MAVAWASGLPPTDRLVLLALADWANDQNRCWPSMPRIAEKTGLDGRTARRVMQRLEAAGFITTERRPGKGIRYTLHAAPDPGHGVPGPSVPGQRVPRTQSTGAPDTESPNTSRTTTKRKKTTSSPFLALNTYPMPEGVDPQHWTDFLANRKRKRLANTASAHEQLISDLARHATPAWPVARLVAFAAGKGWASVRNPDGDTRHDQFMGRSGAPAIGIRGSRPDPALDLYLAAQAELAAERAGEDQSADCGAWPSLSSDRDR